MLHVLAHVVPEAFFDVLKTAPLLLLVYALLYYIENRLTNTPALLTRTAKFGPIVGALAGTIPQCGFSAAASALFCAGYLAPATLISVFLATSDEAVPVMLAGGAGAAQIVLLLVVKFAVAVIGGYLLKYTVFRRFKLATDEPVEVEMSACDCSAGSPVRHVVWHTMRTSLFLFAVMLVLDLIVHLIGEDVLASLLLSDTIFQPLLCAVLGLVPSCAMSVLLSELYLGGTISFGALIAGLSTGAGFGYIVLFQEKEGRRRAFPVIAATFVVAVVGGMLAQAIYG
nr:putative manganese transporter [uncultured Agathobaculum sp.]